MRPEAGSLLSARILVPHNRGCSALAEGVGTYRSRHPWMIQFPSDRSPEVSSRDTLGRCRSPGRGGQPWFVFPCSAANCAGRIAIRVGAIESAAEHLASGAWG